MFKEKDECCRGDLYYAVLDPVVGSEQGGVRPVLIIQNDIGNHRSSTVIAAPLTSRVGEKSPLPTHVEVPPLGRLKTRSLVLLEQLRTLDKSRLDGYVGHLDPRRMCHVDRALKISVGLVGAFNDSPSVRCLCPACAGRYYDDPAFTIRRADPCQSVRETCDFCGSRTGYDYIVRERKAKNEREEPKMQTDTHSLYFLIDGHEISATFAESRNADAIRQVREILLSAFAAGVSPKCGDSLAKSHGPRDNGDGESHVP